MTATVEPAAFTLAAGATQQLTITVNVSRQRRWQLGPSPTCGWPPTTATPAAPPIAGVHYPVAVIPVAPAISVDPTAIEVSQKPGRDGQPRRDDPQQGNGPLEWSADRAATAATPRPISRGSR